MSRGRRRLARCFRWTQFEQDIYSEDGQYLQKPSGGDQFWIPLYVGIACLGDAQVLRHIGLSHLARFAQRLQMQRKLRRTLQEESIHGYNI